MTKLVTILMTLFALGTAYANDGGVAHIKVKGIDPGTAADGTEIKIYGEDAANFMRLLPGYSSVLYYMVPEDVSKLLRYNERGVSIVSKGWTFSMDCSAGTISSNKRVEEAEFVATQPKCTFALRKNYEGGDPLDNLGDTWSMEPKDYQNDMCQ